ncbi:MAG: tRNA lysidine(34) synthetase TilS [Paludibacteraceae bacterium]|nr:tRNA lysidine(34) synthetase TilS [Paludibacteraceae bacterium]
MFLEKVKDYIDKNALCTTNKPIIVGFSGGPDSVALLCVLNALGYTCIAAHCNFHLRGEESDRDMNFAIDLAEKKQIPIKLVHFETKTYAANHHISIEMAARELRYAWFSSLIKETEATAVAIAHHSDDVVETLLINLMRGTGLHGLTGIKPQNGNIIRPLLCVSRQEVLEYLNEIGQDYVIDSSNNENDYLRNKLRNIIIPEMELAIPAVKKNILRTINNLQRSENLQNETVQKWTEKIVSETKGIRIIRLDALRKQVNKEFLLFELLRPYNGTIDIVQNIFDGKELTSGQKFFTSSHVIIKNRNELQIKDLNQENDNLHLAIDENVCCIETPLHLCFELLDKEEVCIKKDKIHCYVDADKIKYPLRIRSWEKGDSFVPFGQTGSKKLSDFFINEKLSLIEKERCLILTNGDGSIMWIIGYRSDNRYRITEKTKKVLHIYL